MSDSFLAGWRHRALFKTSPGRSVRGCSSTPTRPGGVPRPRPGSLDRGSDRWDSSMRRKGRHLDRQLPDVLQASALDPSQPTGGVLSVALQTTRFWHSAARWFFGFPALALPTRLGSRLCSSLTATTFAHLIVIVLLSLIDGFVPLFGLCAGAATLTNFFAELTPPVC